MDDVDVKKLLISKKKKKSHDTKKTYLNISLDIITMMILDRYVSSFLKKLGMTNTQKIIIRLYLLRSLLKNCKKSTLKYGENMK